MLSMISLIDNAQMISYHSEQQIKKDCLTCNNLDSPTYTAMYVGSLLSIIKRLKIKLLIPLILFIPFDLFIPIFL